MGARLLQLVPRGVGHASPGRSPVASPGALAGHGPRACTRRGHRARALAGHGHGTGALACHRASQHHNPCGSVKHMTQTDLARRARVHAGAHAMLGYIVAETAAQLTAQGEGHAIFVNEPHFTDDGVNTILELHNPRQVKTARLELTTEPRAAAVIDFSDDDGTIVFTVHAPDDALDTTALATLVRQIVTLAVVVVRDEFAD